MTTVIFTGLSIPFNEAACILDAVYLPPIKRGDIPRVLEKYDDIDIIGIIDGVFHQTPAVSHREILEAIEHDITVVGGASMGALRACELYPYGMTGVGEIFEAYRDEILDSDDDVAVALDPETLQPMSESYVNIKYNMKFACDNNIITENEKKQLLETAKQTYYPKRTFNYIIQKSDLKEKTKEELLKYIEEKNFDIKYEDAKKTIEYIKSLKMIKCKQIKK